ncbi:MAG: lectin like domain-containing protein [Planctomycetaceae bacterium]|nr:lectin like domain-containing protein [Planctomycetaceae bacterium]
MGGSAHLRGLRLELLEERTLLSVEPTLATDPVLHTAPYAPVVVQQGSGFSVTPAVNYPSSYDLRNVSGTNYVTSVKNQGSWNTCWTFATYASLESSILKAGGATSDFSERNLAYRHGFDWGYNAGGNSYISEAYLSRLAGPINESDDPYAYMGLSDTVTGPVQYYVREMLRFDADSEIKNALMTYGALHTSMYWTDSSYRSSDYTYYYGGTTEGVSQDHAVTIVGWNDSKVTAGGTGAWLIKNSWGSSWGNSGYFWLSYADTMGGNSAESFNSAVPASTYDKEYSWDTFGNVTALNRSYAFNAYTASTGCELKSIGFYTLADAATYTITVYDTFTGGTLSTVMATASGTETYAGYHTIDLTTPVALGAGNDFYVALHITGGGDFPVAFDHAVDGYTSSCTASAGQSYYSYSGTGWTDLTAYDATGNFCIKALVTDGATSTAPATPALASASDTGMSNSDRITKLDNSTSSKTLQFVVGGTVAGATVTIYADGTAIGSAVATGTSTTVTTNGTYDLVDGGHTITARQTESGMDESVDSDSIVIGVDTQVPTCTTPNLVDASDTGISNTDNVTQGSTPEFDGTASDTQVNGYSSGIWMVIVASDDARSATDNTSPFYDATLPTLSVGSRTIKATAYDVAGNSWLNSTGLAITVDRTSPTLTINQASGQADPTTSLPIHFTAVFSEKVNGFDSTDLTGAPAGAVVTVTPVGTTGTTFDVAIDNITADATFSITVAAGKATDDAGNANTASTSTDNTVAFQRLAPSATVALNTSSPMTNDVLTATATKTGYYSNPVTLTYVWLVNGVEKRRVTGTTATTDSFDLGVAGNGDRSDVVTVQVTPSDGVLTGTTVSAAATVAAANVTGRYVFYNNSYYDGGGKTDDDAIATDKTALLPGQKATFANYTSYSRGINGIIVDITGAATPITAADFEFKVGNSNDPTTWAAAPTPSVTWRALSGGVTRVTLIWSDNAIQKKWLQVKVLASADTGLAAPDVFYFGNAIGESGDNTGNATVNATDAYLAASHTLGFGTAPITNVWDYNRDGKVNATDAYIAASNTAAFLNALQLITPVDNQRTMQSPSSLATSSGSTVDGALATTVRLAQATTSATTTSMPRTSSTAAVDAVFENLGKQTIV